MRERIAAVLILACAALLQASVVQRLEIAGAAPNILLLTVISLALLTNSVDGAIYGFIGGLMLSLSAMLALGPHAIVCTVIGYWVGRWGEVSITDEHPVPPLVAGLLGSIALAIGIPLLAFLVSTTTIDGVWGTALLATIWNTILITPVYMAIRAVFPRSPQTAEAVIA